jgi:hypothetical protein
MNRRRVAIALDILAIALTVLAIGIGLYGGFILQIQDLQLSFRTPSRTLQWFVLIVAIRVWLDRRTGPLGISRAPGRQPLLRPDADPFHLEATPGTARRTALAALGIGGALMVLLHDQLLQPYSVPDLGDPLFSIWRIGWVLHQLAVDPLRLFDANIFYPERLTLTFSDPMILPALAAAPMLAAGAHPVLVYNVLLIAGFWLSGVATYVLVERLTRSPQAAFISGLIYASSSFHLEHYSHLELQITLWMPLALLALHMFVSTGRWRYAMFLALAGVAQLYSSMYYAAFFVIYVAAIGAGLLVVYRPPIRRLIVPLVTATAVAAVLAAPIVGPFIAAQPVKGERSEAEIRFYSATPLDYVRPHTRSAVWSGRLPPAYPERAMFPGVAPLVLAGAGLVPPLGGVRFVYALGLVVSLDGSFGLNGVFYPLLHTYLAPFRGIRVPARFGALVGLTLAILAGFGMLAVVRRCQSRSRGRAVLAAAVIAVMIETWPVLSLEPVWKAPPSIYEQLKGRFDVVLAEFPLAVNAAQNLPFMYFSLWHWTPMVNGYSGFVPESYERLAPDFAEFPRSDSIAKLRARGVTHVTVNCGLWDATCEDAVNQIRALRELRLVSETSWQGRPVQLYELARK